MAAGVENWVPTIVYGANGLISGYGEIRANWDPPNLRFGCPPLHSCVSGELPEWPEVAERGGEGVCARTRQQGVAALTEEWGRGHSPPPSRRDLHPNTHTKSSACKLQYGPTQSSRGGSAEWGWWRAGWPGPMEARWRVFGWPNCCVVHSTAHSLPAGGAGGAHAGGVVALGCACRCTRLHGASSCPLSPQGSCMRPCMTTGARGWGEVAGRGRAGTVSALRASADLSDAGCGRTAAKPHPATPGHSRTSPETQLCRGGQLGRRLGGLQFAQFYHTRKLIRTRHKLWLGPSSPPLQPFATNKTCSPTFLGPTKPMACSELGNSDSA